MRPNWWPARARGRDKGFVEAGIAAGGALLVVGAVAGNGLAATVVDMSDGHTWLPGQDGRIVQVNPATGAPERRLIVARDGSELEISQRDGNLLVTDVDTGDLTAVDLTALVASGSRAGASDDLVLVGGGRVVIVGTDPGTVRVVDPLTLADLGRPYRTDPIADAVIDDDGVVWVLTDAGRLTALHYATDAARFRTGVDRPVAGAGPESRLVPHEQGVTVFATDGGAVVQVGAGTDLAVTVPDLTGAIAPAPRSPAALAPASATDAGAVFLLSDAELLQVDVAGLGCDRPGEPAVFNQRVYVPCLGKGRIMVLDPDGRRAGPDIVVPGGGDPRFTLDEGRLFVTSTRDGRAVVVQPDGSTGVVDLGGADVPEQAVDRAPSVAVPPPGAAATRPANPPAQPPRQSPPPNRPPQAEQPTRPSEAATRAPESKPQPDERPSQATEEPTDRPSGRPTEPAGEQPSDRPGEQPSDPPTPPTDDATDADPADPGDGTDATDATDPDAASDAAADGTSTAAADGSSSADGTSTADGTSDTATDGTAQATGTADGSSDAAADGSDASTDAGSDASTDADADADPVVEDAPRDLAAQVQGENVRLTWSPPEGTPVDYRLTTSDGAVSRTVPAGDTSATLTGLPCGRTLTITLTAQYRGGTAVPASTRVTTPDCPVDPADLRPRSVQASPTGPDTTDVRVSWTAPAIPATGYTVSASPGGVSTTAAAGATSATLQGLACGTNVTVTVTATHSGQADGSATANATTSACPPEPEATAATNVRATVSGTTATVTWNAATSGADEYLVRADGGSWTSAGTGTSLQFTDLAYGTYTFTVQTQLGETTATSGASNAVTVAAAPGRPGDPAFTFITDLAPQGFDARVSWAPSAPNGAEVTYTVSWQGPGDSGSFTTTGTSANISVRCAKEVLCRDFVNLSVTITPANSAGEGPSSSGSGSAEVTQAIPPPANGDSAIGWINFSKPGLHDELIPFQVATNLPQSWRMNGGTCTLHVTGDRTPGATGSRSFPCASGTTYSGAAREMSEVGAYVVAGSNGATSTTVTERAPDRNTWAYCDSKGICTDPVSGDPGDPDVEIVPAPWTPPELPNPPVLTAGTLLLGVAGLLRATRRTRTLAATLTPDRSGE